MATTRSFQDMLNEYLPYSLLKEEFIRRDFLISKVDKKNDWKGGKLIVPFQGAFASSVSFGSLTAATDISEDDYVRGEISTCPEIWGSMKFNHRDLMEHNGKVNEQSFLKLLPGAIEDFMDQFKFAVSQNLLTGNHYDSLTADATAGGVLTVKRVERFTLGQKIQVYDAVAGSTTCYVIAINVNADQITVSATRGGLAVDMSTYDLVNTPKIYLDNARTNSMTNLRASLLTVGNGGSATLYGQTKTAYPFLQSLNLDGSTITASNIHQKIFAHMATLSQKGKGKPTTAIMSYKWLGNIMAAVETSKGPYKVAENSTKASLYGWTSITIHGPTGMVECVGVQEMDDDVIFVMDWRSLQFHSNGWFQKRTAPDGKQYYEVRETTGYYYIIDIGLFGDLVVSRPSYCGIIANIP